MAARRTEPPLLNAESTTGNLVVKVRRIHRRDLNRVWLARVRGCTHLVLEVAENNESALHFYRARSFTKLDTAIFIAKKIAVEADLLPPRKLRKPRKTPSES